MECDRLQGCPFYNNRMPMEHGIGYMVDIADKIILVAKRRA